MEGVPAMAAAAAAARSILKSPRSNPQPKKHGVQSYKSVLEWEEPARGGLADEQGN